MRDGRIARWVKRAFDIGTALTVLVVFAPLLVAAAAGIRLTMGSPIFFRQSRPGRQGRLFTVVKFRSMRNEEKMDGRPLSDAERLTPVGRFLRRSSLDELPQLWNVLRGDMSLVGPRPLLIEYMERYTPRQARRHDVRPGITGWAQVNGRQEIPFSRRLELDVWYVENWSLWLDLRILFLTIARILRMSGVRLRQDICEVDDLGLHPETRNLARGKADGQC
jgi:lipopolysaccharide/colanic/teichoic acid biosynthesis glycosyltransferase